MKKIVILWLLLSIFFNGFSQPVIKDLSETDYYLQKSKNQKTAAWLLLGGGTFVGASGYVLFIYEGLQGDGVKSAKAKLDLVMFFGGAAAIASSIPLFIAAARNKKIAVSVTAGLKMENNISQFQPSFVKASYPALSLKIYLK